MSGKLDQSLDEILSTRRSSARRGRGRRAPNTGKAHGVTTAAPVGGIRKTTRPTRPNAKATIPTGPAGGNGESKIIVSNLVSRYFICQLE